MTYQNSPAISVLRSAGECRRFLVMIRCGSGIRPSLFHEAIPDDRNFDVAVNYFAPPHRDDYFHRHAEFLVSGGLSKYHAAKLLMHHGILGRYEGVYLLDDDIELHFDPSDFLAYCGANGFAMAQAALTDASDGAYRITFHHPGFEYRLTNFIEVMAPYFSRSFLLNVVERFDLSISTWGLDVLWGSSLAEHDLAAIVDRFRMSHLRKRDYDSGAFYAYLRSRGIDCVAELNSVLATLGISAYEIRFEGGLPVRQSVFRMDETAR
jgi:hypothetical protein